MTSTEDGFYCLAALPQVKKSAVEVWHKKRDGKDASSLVNRVSCVWKWFTLRLGVKREFPPANLFCSPQFTMDTFEMCKIGVLPHFPPTFKTLHIHLVLTLDTVRSHDVFLCSLLGFYLISAICLPAWETLWANERCPWKSQGCRISIVCECFVQGLDRCFFPGVLPCSFPGLYFAARFFLYWTNNVLFRGTRVHASVVVHRPAYLFQTLVEHQWGLWCWDESKWWVICLHEQVCCLDIQTKTLSTSTTHQRSTCMHSLRIHDTREHPKVGGPTVCHRCLLLGFLRLMHVPKTKY